MDVNAKNMYEWVPLRWVLARRGTDVVPSEAILRGLFGREELCVNARMAACQGGAPVLQTAATLGDELAVQLLLAHKDLLVDAVDEYGLTALYEASANGKPVTVQNLLQAGATVELPAGGTPLDAAFQANQKEVVDVLVAAGADIFAYDEHGLSPLHSARPSQQASDGLPLSARFAEHEVGNMAMKEPHKHAGIRFKDDDGLVAEEFFSPCASPTCRVNLKLTDVHYYPGGPDITTHFRSAGWVISRIQF